MHVLEVREKNTLGLSELQDRLFPLISGMTAKNPPIHIRIIETQTSQKVGRCFQSEKFSLTQILKD